MESHNEFEERFWIVPADHPYCLGRNNIPDVYMIGDGWKIVWRSFDSMKQDNIYATEAEAKAAAQEIAGRPVMTSACDEPQLLEYSDVWVEASNVADGLRKHFDFKEVTHAILVATPQDRSLLN